jgi:hypothetical protein
MNINRLLLLLFVCVSVVLRAQVQPTPIPGLPGIGVSFGLNTTGDIQSVLVYQNGQQVQSLPVCTSPLPQKPPIGTLNMADLNFDGFNDLLLQVTSKDDNFKYCVWLYNPKTHRLDPSPQLSELTNPRPDPKTRTITTFTNQNCQGACHEQKTYAWTDGQLHLTKIETQSLDQNLSVNVPGCGYILTVQEEKNGKMEVVSKDRVNSQGAKVCW